MAFVKTKEGAHYVDAVQLLAEAHNANVDPVRYINQKLAPVADSSYGSPFKQVAASLGYRVGIERGPFTAGAPVLGDVVKGTVAKHLSDVVGLSAATNTATQSTPYGTESRVIFPLAVLDAMENLIQPDRTTDGQLFDQMVAFDVPVAGAGFLQPILNYSRPSAARASSVTELSKPNTLLQMTTSDRMRTIPTYGIAMEVSDQALEASTLDLVAMSLARFFDIERDGRVYQYLSAIFAGDSDGNSGAVPATTSNSLDSAASGGVLTHRAWIKWLAAKFKSRRITHVIMDIDTYLKVESRTGRPGTTGYDPRLAVIDPQARPMSGANTPWGSDVQFMIVPTAAEGGPVPANTVWGLDASVAITRVRNIQADYQASAQDVTARKLEMVFHWSEDCYRTFNADLTPFSVLSIS